ncbi:DUF1064 domain-containing protein [Priestia megaterium]
MRRNRSKYNNKKTKIGNVIFDSIAEAEYYKLLRNQKEDPLHPLLDFELQPEFLLIPSYKRLGDGKDNKTKTIRKTSYKADFRAIYNGYEEVLDVKGVETDVFKIKRKLLEYKYPEINFYLVKKNGNGTWKKYK